MVDCENCGKTVAQTNSQFNKARHHYCSNRCHKEFIHKMTFEYRKCEICNTSFEVSKKSKQRFCSTKCQSEWQRSQTGVLNPNFSRIKIKCEVCDKYFYVKQYKVKTGQHLFCSIECRQEWFANVYSKTTECQDRSRKNAIKMLSSGSFSKTLSNPQRLINELLNDMCITFENEKSCKYYAIDNYLTDSKLMIEVMGDYWHCNPIRFANVKNYTQSQRIAKDKAKHTFIKKHYNVEILYLWESDINKRFELCKMLIQEYIKNNGVLENYHSFNYNFDNKKLSLNDKLIIPYQDR